MNCDVCEYRFKCLTAANEQRPIRAKINWAVGDTCGRCERPRWKTKANGYADSRPKKFVHCEHKDILVHQDSKACEEFVPTTQIVDKVYAEIFEELKRKNSRTKLPIYCELT